VSISEQGERDFGLERLGATFATAIVTCAISVFIRGVGETQVAFGEAFRYEDLLMIGQAFLFYVFAYAVLYALIVEATRGMTIMVVPSLFLAFGLMILATGDFRSPQFRVQTFFLFGFALFVDQWVLGRPRSVLSGFHVLGLVGFFALTATTLFYLTNTPVLSFPLLVVENPRLEPVEDMPPNVYSFSIDLTSYNARSRRIKGELVFLDGIDHDDPTAAVRNMPLLDEGKSTSLTWSIVIEESPREEFFVWVTSSSGLVGKKVSIYYDTERESWRSRDSLESVRFLEKLIWFLKANAL